MWQPKVDAPAIVVLDSGAISVLLAAWPTLQYLAPTLVGKAIDVGAFCALGPPFTPPVTMADVVWSGLPPADGRPHTLLTVVRAIADQEAFAKYCENPDNLTATWHTYDQNPLCVDRIGEVWNCVMYVGSTPLPSGTSLMRMTLLNGLSSQCYWGLADPSLVEQLGADDQSAIWKTGLGGTAPALGAYTQYDFSGVWSTHPSAVPMLVARDGYLAPPTNHFCVHIEYFAPGSSQYTPPESDEDPDVELPDGSGATVDQLEVKLDAIQELLRGQANPNFALDLSTTLGPAETVAGDLVDAVGLLLTVIDRPDTVSEWWGDPPRYPHMAYITFGNPDGWWSPWQVVHENSVYLPLPTGATKFSVVCRPPMRATATFYRPTMGPS